MIIYFRGKIVTGIPLYYFGSRITTPFRRFITYVYAINLKIAKKKFIKKDIEAIYIEKDRYIIRLLDGRKYYWDPTDRHSLLGLANTGEEWEKEDTNFLRNLIKEGDNVIDVGASYGFHSVLFARLIGPSGIVYSFEPSYVVFQELLQNLNLNDIKNCKVEQSALGNTSGHANLYFYKDLGSGASSFKKRWIGKPQVERCKLMTLDEHVHSKKMKNIKFIKCDVEGAELDVFKGSLSLLKRDKPTVMFEVAGAYKHFGYTSLDIYSFFEDLGYRICYVSNNKLHKMTKDSIRDYFGNCFAVMKP